METTALERRAQIRSHLAIAPRPKIDDESIEQLQVILHRAKELGDEAFLIQTIAQCSGALAELHAQRIRAQAQPQ